METTHYCPNEHQIGKFKIDLIVWKLVTIVNEKEYHVMFKIDLIVWKRGVSGRDDSLTFRFKIDLIVWKRIRCFPIGGCPPGLKLT